MGLELSHLIISDELLFNVGTLGESVNENKMLSIKNVFTIGEKK